MNKQVKIVVWLAVTLVLLVVSYFYTYVGTFAVSGFPFPYVEVPIGPLAPGVERSTQILWSGLIIDFIFWAVISFLILFFYFRIKK